MCNNKKSVFSVHIACTNMANILCFIFIFLSLLQDFSLVECFNLDTINYIRHSGQPGSMFGFSVAEHKVGRQNWVLVGAPEADTGRQPGVYKGGAVYKCYTDSDRCEEIRFDNNGNNNFSNGAQMDEKSNQWFGATVRSSVEGDRVVACAPRYVYFTSNKNKREPVGTCFVASHGFNDVREYATCRTKNWGYHRQGWCQLGLAADFSKSGERVYMGAVGSWYWQGQLYSVDTNAHLPFPVPPKIFNFQEGQVYSQNTYNRPDVISTKEGPPQDDDSYLGYSVVTGNFGGGKGSTDVAAGMPRGAGLVGKIVLYAENMTNLQNITGEQLGAYFGYSISAVDLDGDGTDDLIVGAPLFTDFSKNDESYENGKVYFIYQGNEPSKPFGNRLHSVVGKHSKGRFGLAVTSLGDINLDGYNDVAVGAPYEKEIGAVYIFHGSSEGIQTEPSQIITPKTISNPVSTFGFSLSGGRDLDDNEYPDLIIGAYDSDASVFLRARPVVKIESSVEFGIVSKQITLEEANCTIRAGTRVPCLPLNLCVKYNGTGVADTLDLDINVVLDAKKTRYPRMYFLTQEDLRRNLLLNPKKSKYPVRNYVTKDGENNIIFVKKLSKGYESCESIFVYVKPDMKDKLTLLEAEVKFNLTGENQWETGSMYQYQKDRYRRSLFPILNRNDPLSKKDAISIQKNCGSDNICIPNLRLNVKPNLPQYLLGSGERLEIEVVVQNDGEDSFESVFDMTIPKGLNYTKVEQIGIEKEVPILCSPPSFHNNNTLHCDIGNPLPREKVVIFRAIFQPFHKEGLDPRYEFYASVNSSNPEVIASLQDNVQSFNVSIRVDTKLLLSGSSLPAEIHYDTSLYDSTDITRESQIGPQVVHTYSIRNKGPSDIKEAEIIFNWPSYTLGGDPLLYLLEPPEKIGPVKCDHIPNINPKKLRLDKKKNSYLQESIAEAQGSSSGHQGILTDDFKRNSQSTYSSSSSASSSSFASSSSGKSKSGHKKTNGKSNRKELSSEERHRIDEIERRKEEEELSMETGDSSDRYSKRVKGSKYDNAGGSGTDYRGGVTVSHSQGGSDNSYISERGRIEKTNSGNSGSGVTYSPGLTFSSPVDSSGRRVEEEIARGYSGSNVYHGSTRTGSSEVNNRNYNNKDYDSTNYVSSSSNVNQGTNFRNQFNAGVNSNNNRRIYPDHDSHNVGSHSVNIIPGEGHEVYAKEEHHYRNSTWSSADGGAPKTYESSNWSINDNGTIRNGSTNDYNARGSFDHDIRVTDEDLQSGRAKVFKTEEHKERNKTWSSSEGGQPKVYETTNWRVTENGNVRNGSYSNVYVDGEVGQDIGSSSLGSVDTSRSQYDASRHRSSSSSYGATGLHQGNNDALGSGSLHQSGSSNDGADSRHSQYDASRNSGDYGSSSHRQYEGSSHTGHHQTSGSSYDASRGSAYDSSRGTYDASRGASNDASRGSSYDSSRGTYDASRGASNDASRGSSYDSTRGMYDASRGASNDASRSHHDASSTSVNRQSSHDRSSASGSDGLSQSFSNLGAIARGPTDGVARTYTFDVEDKRNSGQRDHQQNSNSRQSTGSSSSAKWGTDGQVDISSGRSHGVVSSDSNHQGNADYLNRAEGNIGNVHNQEGSYSSSSYSHRDSHQTGHQQYNQASGYHQEGSNEQGVDKKFQYYNRFTRDVDAVENIHPDTFKCGPTQCTKIKCTVGPLTRGQEALFAFRSRVWVQTIKKFASNPAVNLSSEVIGRVTAIPHIGRPDNIETQSAEVSTVIRPKAVGEKTQIVPLWVVVLAACAGAIILMLLVYLLYKCGFFKRNRPSDSSEKEPLNRNGHYQSGDEAL